MTPEANQHLDKARECLARARIILAAGVGKDAGRNADLVGFHAAQALIIERLDKTVKTHRGVHRVFAKLAKDDPKLADLARFLSQAYNSKAVADYELGPEADVPLDRASAAIDTAERFVACIAGLLASLPPPVQS